MTSFHPSENAEVKVGPVNTLNGTSYRYSITDDKGVSHLSVNLYHNSASARADSRRPQRLSNSPDHQGQIEPKPERPSVGALLSELASR